MTMSWESQEAHAEMQSTRIEEAFERNCKRGTLSVSGATNWGEDNNGDPIMLNTIDYYVQYTAIDGAHVVAVLPTKKRAQDLADKLNALKDPDAVREYLANQRRDSGQ